MGQSGLSAGGDLAYREGQAPSVTQRVAALALVSGLHVAVIGGFVLINLRKPPPPPEKVMEVSFITEAQAAAAPPAPPPPQPVEQPQPTPPTPTPVRPEPTMLATPAPTPSPMSAPPTERPTPVETAAPAQPTAAPQQVAAAATASTSTTATAAPVTPPSFTAAYLNNPGPVYPPSSRRKREQGVVRLRVQVSPDGAPLQVLLDRTSGSADLDSAALDVVKKRWKFAPAKQAGAPVSAWVIVPMEFSLNR